MFVILQFNSSEECVNMKLNEIIIKICLYSTCLLYIYIDFLNHAFTDICWL